MLNTTENTTDLDSQSQNEFASDMRGYHLIISVNGTKTNPNTRSAGTFTPKHIFQRLPQQKPSLSYRRSSVDQIKGKDHRTGPLQIDWMDFEVKESAGRRQSITVGKEKERGRGTHYM